LVNVFNNVISKINAILDKLPTAVTSRIGFESIDQLDSVSIGGATQAPEFEFGGGGTGVNTVASAFAGRNSDGGQGRTLVTMDGRQLSESTGRYRAGPARRQGL